MTHQQERDKLKTERKVTEMKSRQIIGYLMTKHKFFLAVLVIAIQSTYIVTHTF